MIGGAPHVKIYHYSATSKPILFILDGTDEERALLRDYFSQFDRFIFCGNTSDDILSAMNTIVAGLHRQKPVDAFSPKSVVKLFI